MAKKQSKQKKPAKRAGGAGAGAGAKAQPLAALYRLDAGTDRGDAVRAVLDEQGVRVRTVSEEHLGCPVGAIAGLPGFKLSAKPFEGEVPESEFMLLCGFTSDRMNRLLAAMRDADASVGCKAQLTEHNRLWPFAVLVREVSREHALMTGE